MIQCLQTGGFEIAHVLLTHWHGDHTGGVPDLVSYEAKLRHCIHKNSPDHDQQPIAEGQVFTVQGATVRSVYTPGHAHDHMCFVLVEENALFTGDNVLGHGYSVEEDLGMYMQSLRKMQALSCSKGYPAHGAVIDDLPMRMQRYLHHKQWREQQVIEALPRRRSERGLHSGVSVQELLNVLHGELPQHVVELALQPFVSQILRKLAEDRKAAFMKVNGTRQWFLTESVKRTTANTRAC
jgi:hydrolase